MNSSSSFFWGDMQATTFAQLKGPIQTKYVIVGGGIAGLSAAYFLLEHGETDIVIIERDTIGSGSTGHSAGMLVCEPETASWEHLVKKYGGRLAGLYWDAQVAALAMVSKIATHEKMKCDLMVEELLILGGSALARSHVLHDFTARKPMKGSRDILLGEILEQELKTHLYTVAERVKGSISLNPLLFARGFAEYLHGRGVRVYENTPLVSAQAPSAQTPHGEISYETIFKCLGTAKESTEVTRYLTTLCATRKLSDAELKYIGLIDKDMFFDNERRSYHYGKVTSDNRLLVGYGDMKCKNEYQKSYIHKPHVENIKRFIERAFPTMGIGIEYAWSAQYALSKTDLPAVAVDGASATINGAGTQLASIAAASYAVSKILNKAHPLDELFKA